MHTTCRLRSEAEAHRKHKRRVKRKREKEDKKGLKDKQGDAKGEQQGASLPNGDIAQGLKNSKRSREADQQLEAADILEPLQVGVVSWLVSSLLLVFFFCGGTKVSLY